MVYVTLKHGTGNVQLPEVCTVDFGEKSILNYKVVLLNEFRDFREGLSINVHLTREFETVLLHW